MRLIVKLAAVLSILSMGRGFTQSAPSNDPKLSYGSRFTYISTGRCTVESGKGIMGTPIFRIEARDANGKAIIPELTREKRQRLVVLMAKLKDQSFSMSYPDQVLQADGQMVQIEVEALSYHLKYVDDFERAKKSPVVREIVKILKVALESDQP